MKQVQRVVTLALALLLIGLPAVTMAQTSSGGTSSGTQDKATGKSMDKPSSPSASPSTGTTSGSTATGTKSGSTMPMSAEDCKNNGWQKFGAKTEAECVAKVVKK